MQVCNNANSKLEFIRRAQNKMVKNHLDWMETCLVTVEVTIHTIVLVSSLSNGSRICGQDNLEIEGDGDNSEKAKGCGDVVGDIQFVKDLGEEAESKPLATKRKQVH